MSEKPKRRLMYNRPDGDVIGANYWAAEMDEWLKTEVLPILRECEAELNDYYTHENRGDHPYSVRKREANIAANPATPLIAQLETTNE